jgi:hypothetical protein
LCQYLLAKSTACVQAVQYVAMPNQAVAFVPNQGRLGLMVQHFVICVQKAEQIGQYIIHSIKVAKDQLQQAVLGVHTNSFLTVELLLVLVSAVAIIIVSKVVQPVVKLLCIETSVLITLVQL